MVYKPPPVPPPPSATATRKPLGVPADYSVAQPTSDSIRGDTFNALDPSGAPVSSQHSRIAPRYFDGDELVPAGLAPEKIAAIQKALATAGLIGPKTKFRLGVWDETTRGAYKNLLEFANVYGVDEKEALRRYASTEAMRGDGSIDGAPTRQPLVTRSPNPDDLRATFETVLRAKTGRRPDPAAVQRMVASYTSQDVATQTAAYNAAEAGGNVPEMVNPKTFAEQQAKAIDPVGTEVTEMGDTGAEFFDALRDLQTRRV